MIKKNLYNAIIRNAEELSGKNVSHDAVKNVSFRADLGICERGRGPLWFPSSPLLLSVSPLSPLPLIVWPPEPAIEGLEERCKLPSGVRGKAPAENEFGAH